MAENRKWEGNTGGGTLGQRGLIFFFRWWNLRLGYAFMALTIPFYMLFAPKRYLAIYLYFRKQFGFSKWKSFTKTYKNHFLFGQIILDRFAVFAGQKDIFDIEIIGVEHYYRLADGKKGFIIAGAHIGNFEICGYLLNSPRKKINALIYAGETAVVQKNRSIVLEKNNINLIPASDDMAHVFAINSALQNGEIASMHCDRNHGSQKAVECDFIRGKADFPLGAFLLAASFDVEILAIFVIKISTKKYTVFVQPIYAEAAINHKQQAENLVKSYVGKLENILKQFPEQWFNYYEFWKS